MTKGKIVSAIDIGSSKIRAAVAKLDSSGTISLLGMGSAPSLGTWGGLVSDIDKAAEPFRSAIRQAETASGVTMAKPRVGIGIYPQSFYGTHCHVGSSGHRDRLWIKSNDEIYTRRVNAAIESTNMCLEKINIRPGYLIYRPLASSLSVLEPGEKKTGLILMDMGNSITDVVIFKDANNWQACTLNIGGSNITTDIAIALDISWETAERLKIRFGKAIAIDTFVEDGLENSFIKDEQGDVCFISNLNTIITVRLTESMNVLKSSLTHDKQICSMVLTGGTSGLPGITALTEQIFQVPMRIGIPRGIKNLPIEYANPQYATIIGLLVWNAEHNKRHFTNRILRRVF